MHGSAGFTRRSTKRCHWGYVNGLKPRMLHWLYRLISALEVSQLVKKGVLDLPLPMPVWFDAALTEAGIQCIPVTPQLLHASTILPDIHKDPADRIIIATAQKYSARLVTADEAIRKYPNLQTVWAV
ncbi:hypothetical protein THIOKS12320044 [Thiocapsa sp. KS1]|nr:type II toxin-antitoxin system VapC family toxin [Thiocapsa sp. KS1]CRI65304.1 hypothetical protein THIOKS12320044 [Thiocapsa sp. KS1]